jgi:hypothetical protein
MRSVLEESKAAAGGAAWDDVRTLYTRLRIRAGGLDGTAEFWQDLGGGRYAERFTLGPVQGASGFDGTIAWVQDSSGAVRERQGEEEREATATQAFRASLAFWYPERWPAQVEYAGTREDDERRFDVFIITPQGGRVFELWIDHATHLIDRTVERGGVATVTVFCSDYRPVGDVKLAFAMRRTIGESRYDQLMSVEEVRVNAHVDDTRFQKPSPPSPHYRFGDGQSSTTTPFELINNHIYLPVQLNGSGPYLMMLDTAGANIITPSVAAELGLHPRGALPATGVGEKREDVAFVKVATLAVGALQMDDQLFAVLPMEDLFHDVEGVAATGIVGYELLKRLVVNIDHTHGKVTLTRPASFRYVGSGTAVPFTLAGRLPQVDGSIDGFAGKFAIDTGSRSSVDLNSTFVADNQLEQHFKPRCEALTGWGVGGRARSAVARGQSLRLGRIEVQRPVVLLSMRRAGADSNHYVAGYIGGGVLKRFNITFDYGQQRMFFEPNSTSGQPDVFDRSGMWLNRSGRALAIDDVTPGGPAEAAGLRPGDRIVAVDGQRIGERSLRVLRERFTTDPPGTVLRLRVARDRSERDLALCLREVI